MSKQDELVFVPLGGVGEIGMNLALYGYGHGKTRQWLAVDMGVAFGKDDLPGVDAVLPDIGFLLSQKKNLAGIAITHAHEDHFGALFDFWPQLEVPVFMSPFAAGLLAAKKAGEPGAPDIPVRVVEQGGRITAGPFEVRQADRRGPVRGARRGGCPRPDLRFHQRHPRRRQPQRSRCR